MQILVCPTSQALIDESPEGLFQSTNGKYFSYKVTYHDGEYVTITDSIGRIMPMDIDEIADIAEILARLVRFRANSASLEQFLLDELLNTSTANERQNETEPLKGYSTADSWDINNSRPRFRRQDHGSRPKAHKDGCKQQMCVSDSVLSSR